MEPHVVTIEEVYAALGQTPPAVLKSLEVGLVANKEELLKYCRMVTQPDLNEDFRMGVLKFLGTLFDMIILDALLDAQIHIDLPSAAAAIVEAVPQEDTRPKLQVLKGGLAQ